jgi:hypothetical protein
MALVRVRVLVRVLVEGRAVSVTERLEPGPVTGGVRAGAPVPDPPLRAQVLGALV